MKGQRDSCLRLAELIVVSLLFASCESLLLPTKEALFHSAFPVTDTNNSLRLDIVESSIVSGLGSAVTLSVSNRSKHLIVFPADFGPRAFQYNPDRTEWVELENFVGLPGRPRILGRKGSDIPHMGLVDFGAKELLTGAPAEIRIVVRGNFLLEDETLGDPVVAYLDVDLDP